MTSAETLSPSERLSGLVAAYPQLGRLSPDELMQVGCRLDIGLWAEVRRGYVNADFHWEWYDLARTARRLCVMAGREHSKSECFSVNNVAWHSIYQPGIWSYIFCNSGDQGEKILGRTVAAIGQDRPDLVDNATVAHAKEIVLANGSRITVRGSGAAVRGAHPDLIVGDDVQDENNTATQMQRDRLKSWWFGTVGGMAHPGTTRVVNREMRQFGATRIILVGTPFHSLDLLMGCRSNEMYEWHSYPAAGQTRHGRDKLDS